MTPLARRTWQKWQCLFRVYESLLPLSRNPAKNLLTSPSVLASITAEANFHSWWLMKVWKCQLLSHVWFFVTPWAIADRLLCPWNSPGKNTGMGGLPLPSPGDPPNPGTEPGSPALQADSSLSEPPGKPLLTSPGVLASITTIANFNRLNGL